MKTLQNNYTTPEQSKRLLEIRLPQNTADMYYQWNKRKDRGETSPNLLERIFSEEERKGVPIAAYIALLTCGQADRIEFSPA